MPPTSATALAMLWLVRLLSGELPANPNGLEATVTPVVPAAQAAGVPIVINVHFTNTGRGMLRYRCDDVETYPAAWFLIAHVTSADGTRRSMRMSNGQSAFSPEEDDETDAPFQVAPGQTVRFPAVLPPLPAGEYSLRIEGVPYRVSREGELTVISWPAPTMERDVRLIIREDARAVRAYQEELFTRITQGDVLAFHMVTLRLDPRHVEALLGQTLNADPRVALRAADELNRLSSWPEGADAIVVQALLTWGYSQAEGAWRVRDALANLAVKMRSDLGLDACDELARTGKDNCFHFVQIIARFPQPRATDLLREYLSHFDRSVRQITLRCLADRKDPEARELLVAAAKDPRSSAQWRNDVIRALANYVPDDAAVEVIRDAADDPEDEVRRTAKRILRRIEQAATTAPSR